MATISLCMIVKNEEAVLERCLDSVKDAVDEIIIVDTGSTDKTVSIAKKYTEKVFEFDWVYDFSAARNYSFSKAEMDYQMWMDADDILPQEEKAKLLALKETIEYDAVDMVTMKYYTHFDDKGNPILTSTRERLMKREKNFEWQDPVHECIPLTENILHTDITIWHRKEKRETVSTRNIEIYENAEKSGKIMSPRQQYYFARELKDHALYAKSVYYFEKFLHGKQGWSEDNIAACYNLSICYKQLGDYSKILPVLIKSFEFDSPRAEICTEIGYYYKDFGNYAAALKWFDLACKLDKPESLGFVLSDYWGYIPNIECCVCCYELGEYEKAMEYNENAAKYKPDHEAVKSNRKILKEKISEI